MVIGTINREVAKYTSRPEVIKKRVAQNKARRMMMKAGKVHKGDGKDVDHKTPLSKGGGNSPSNLRVRSQHAIALSVVVLMVLCSTTLRNENDQKD